MTGDEVFDTIAHEMTALDGVSRNHRGSLIVSGSSSGAVRAMTSGGQVVVKLDPMRTAALVDAGGGHTTRVRRTRGSSFRPTSTLITCAVSSSRR